MLLLASISANAYFNEIKTTPQPISIADIAPPPANIRLESSSSTQGNADPIVVAAPPGVRAGWVLIATAGTRGTTTFTPPAGWSAIKVTDSPTRQVTVRSFFHIAGPSEPASYAFANTPHKETTIGILAYSGVRAASPIEASAGAGGKTATATAPVVNASFDTRRMVAVAWNAKDPFTFTGATEVWQEHTGGGAGGAADAAQAAGPTDPTTATQKAVEWAIQTIVLNGAP